MNTMHWIFPVFLYHDKIGWWKNVRHSITNFHATPVKRRDPGSLPVCSVFLPQGSFSLLSDKGLLKKAYLCLCRAIDVEVNFNDCGPRNIVGNANQRLIRRTVTGSTQEKNQRVFKPSSMHPLKPFLSLALRFFSVTFFERSRIFDAHSNVTTEM